MKKAPPLGARTKSFEKRTQLNERKGFRTKDRDVVSELYTNPTVTQVHKLLKQVGNGEEEKCLSVFFFSTQK